MVVTDRVVNELRPFPDGGFAPARNGTGRSGSWTGHVHPYVDLLTFEIVPSRPQYGSGIMGFVRFHAGPALRNVSGSMALELRYRGVPVYALHKMLNCFWGVVRFGVPDFGADRGALIGVESMVTIPYIPDFGNGVLRAERHGMCGARVIKCMPDGEAVQVIAGDTEAANDINALVTNACTPALVLGALVADARQRVGLCDCALMVEAVLAAACIEPFPGDVVLAPDTPTALVYAAATVVNVTLADGIVEIDEARIELLRAEIAQHVSAELAAVLNVVRPYHVARATRPVGMLHVHDARSPSLVVAQYAANLVHTGVLSVSGRRPIDIEPVWHTRMQHILNVGRFVSSASSLAMHVWRREPGAHEQNTELEVRAVLSSDRGGILVDVAIPIQPSVKHWRHIDACPRPARSVAVFVPCYNCERTIERTLRSVWVSSKEIRAVYPDVRVDIMVVDDGSTDSSRAVIMRFHDEVGASGDSGTVVKALAHVKNRGIANAYNTMYRNTDADLIGFLDADDEYLPEHLLYSVEMLARSREASYISTWARVTMPVHDVWKVRISQTLLQTKFLYRQCVERMGGFPDVNYEQDIWLSTMALALCSGLELKHETVLYTCTPDNHCGEQIAKFQDPNYNDFAYLADNRDAAKRMGIPSYPAMINWLQKRLIAADLEVYAAAAGVTKPVDELSDDERKALLPVGVRPFPNTWSNYAFLPVTGRSVARDLQPEADMRDEFFGSLLGKR